MSKISLFVFPFSSSKIRSFRIFCAIFSKSIDFSVKLSYNKADTYESEKENEICFIPEFCRAFPRGRSYT